MLDILIAVLIGIVTLATAYLGVHVTLHPAESPREKFWYKTGFAACGIVGCLLIGFQTWRNDKAQDELKGQMARIEKNTKTPPNVTVNNNIPSPQVIYPPADRNPSVGSLNLAKVEFPGSLDANPFAINIHLVNTGQIPIHDVYFWETATFQPIGQVNSQNDSNSADKKAYASFLKAGKIAIVDSKKSGHSPAYYSVGEDRWGTMFLHPTSEEVEGVLHGTTRLYLFAYAEWEEGRSTYVACRWLQPPSEVNYGSGASLVLHDCSW